MDMSTIDPTATDVATTSAGSGETTTEKLVGDPAVDITDATYRFVADTARSLVFEAVKGQFPHFEATRLGQHFELIVGYLLAAAVELAPGQSLLPQRQRLAQNLRVQTYQEIENKLFEFGKERFVEFAAKRADGDVHSTHELLRQVKDMIDEAQHRTDRKIDEVVNRMMSRGPSQE
jgi:hypothetical protein